MTSGDKGASQRRAGQRADELLPGENSGVPQVGDEATGSPAGGLASSGIEGLPTGDGAPGDAELSDVEDPTEPQSGFAGGAVGGTPANKRTSGD
ncbi:MAG TPA: hypothetical protein VGJ26_02830 [Pirellulales bacterium]|jgi:hypothetical protein